MVATASIPIELPLHRCFLPSTPIDWYPFIFTPDSAMLDRRHIVRSDFINVREHELTRTALIGLLLLKRKHETRQLTLRRTQGA
jgi:hypothetical protein